MRIHLPWPLVAAGVAGGILGLIFLFRFRPKSDSAPARFYNAFAGGVRQILVSPSLAATGLTLGFIVQALSCSVFALSLKAVVSVECPWLNMLWVFPVIGAVSAVPSVAGLGVREGVSMFLLKLYGVPETDAVAASLLGTGTTLVWAAVGGIVLWHEERLFEKQAPGNVTAPAPVTLSVVIPALNEAEEIGETIKRARLVPEVCEIIVVDGGSTDGTKEIAGELGCRVIESAPGRGKQLRAGAALATGNVVMLLHADTWLPADAGVAVSRFLHDSTAVAGGFWKVFREGSLLLRGSRFKCLPRLIFARRVMGDQAMFIRREALMASGGVPDVPLMEEFELCRQLRPLGRLALADAVVKTSARRFAKLGALRTYARMWRVSTLYALGKSPAELREIYEKD